MMLSRLVRSAPARQLFRSQVGRFSTTIDAATSTEQELLASISSLENVDAQQPVLISRAGEDSFNLEPVDDAGLVNGLAQQHVDGAEAEADEGFLEAVGLGPFHRRASLVVTGALTALSNEFYVLNEETFVAACLFSGFTVMYVNLREPALEAYKTFQEETLNAQREAEDKHIAACKTLINAQSGGETIVDEVKAAFAEKEALVHAEAAAKSIAEKNKVAKDFEARLQALVNRKSDEENKAYKELIDNVYEQVLESATNDAKFKKAALQYALTAITSAEKAGANPTVELYASKLKQ